MQNLSLRITFNYNTGEIVLSGIGYDNIVKPMNDDSLQYIEYTLNDVGDKWIFSLKKI